MQKAGGGSDSSIAKVTFRNQIEDVAANIDVANVQNNVALGNYFVLSEGTADVILYGGKAVAVPDSGTILVYISGAATVDDNGAATITGDCVLGIAPAGSPK